MMFQSYSFDVEFMKHHCSRLAILIFCLLGTPVFASSINTPNGYIPTVSQISGPAAGIYNSNNQLIFTVEFSDAVTPVFPEQGQAFLQLQLDSGVAYAQYVSHQDSKITFQYTPSTNDYDFDGVTVTGFYQLNFAENEVFSATNLAEKVEFSEVFIEHSNLALLPQGGLYLAQDKLEFLLKWGRVGSITMSGELPKMSINIGVNQYLLTAEYSQSGELVFTHEITELDYQAGDVSIDELFFDDSVLLAHAQIGSDNSGGSHDLVVTNSNFIFQDGSSSEFIIGLSDAPEALDIERPIGDYKAGDVIEYVLQYSGNITVTGEPQLLLMINGVEVVAQYSSGSGTNTLVFSYVLTSDMNNVGDIQVIQLQANNATFTADNNSNVAINIDAIVSPSTQTAMVTLSSDSETYLNETFTVLIQSNNTNFALDISNISVINGEVEDFQLIDNNYLVTIAPTSDGEVTVSLIGLTALGVDDNKFLITRVYDSQSPQIVSSVPESQNLIVDSKLTQLTLTFNEDVILHESMGAEIQLTVTTANLTNEPVNISNALVDGSAINIVMNQVMIPGGHYSLTVPSSMVTDLAGNLFTDNSGNDYLLSYTTQNLAPTINNDSYVLNEDNSMLFDVLTNDSDAEDYLDMSSVAIIKAPEHGNVTVNKDGTLLYIPHANVATSDTLSYRVSDEQGLQSEESFVSLDILPVNDFPVLQKDLLPKYLVKDQMFSIDLAPTDVDSETVSITLLSAPEWVHLAGNVLSGTPPNSGLAEISLALNDESLTNNVDIDLQVLTGESDSVGLAAQWSQPAALLNQNIDLNLSLYKLVDMIDSQQYQVDIVLSENALVSAMSENCAAVDQKTLTCAMNTEDTSEQTTIKLLPLSVGELVTHVTVKYEQSDVIAQQFDLNINENFSNTADENIAIEENTGAMVAEVNGDSVGPEILVFGDKGLPVKIIDVLSGETLSYINNQGNTVALVQADFNTDSLNDILVVNSDTKVSALYLNKGNGIFDVASTEFAMADGAIVADVNSDANADIIFYDDNVVTTWINSGAGQFLLSQTETFDFVIDNIALADIDGDGESDLVIQTDHQIKLILSSENQQGEQSQVSQIEYEFANKVVSFAFAAGTTQNSTNLLVLTDVTAEQPYAAHSLAFNVDNKTLSKSDSFSEAEPKNMTLVDVNRDDISDLILTNQNGNTQIYLNQPMASKTYAATTEVIVGQFKQVFVADTNNDQMQDLISLDNQRNIQVFQARQDANFTVYNPVDLAINLLSSEFEIAEFSDSQEMQITLENLSENDATGMFLQFSLHDGVTLTSDDHQCITNGNELTCYLNTLASNDEFQLSLNLVTANNLNLEDVQVTVGSNSPDSNTENNSQTIRLSAKASSTVPEVTDNEQSKSSGSTNTTFIFMILLMLYWRRLMLGRK